MARMIPPVFDTECRSPGERTVFERLEHDPATKEWVVFHSQDVAEHVSQVMGEIDFIVVVPKLGVICLEIKAHKKVRRAGGAWYLGNDGPNYRGPAKQANEGTQSIRQIVKEARPDLDGLVFMWAVIFTHATAVERFETDEWQPWQLIDAAQFEAQPIGELLTFMLESERKRLTKVRTAGWFKPSAGLPTIGQRDVLTGLFRPDFELCESPALAKSRRAGELRRYTEEQFAALDAMDANQQVIFEGPAGTGKTVLALECARREASAGQKVLVLCFNKLLGRSLSAAIRDFEGDVTAAHVDSWMMSLLSRTERELIASEDRWRDLPSHALAALFEQPLEFDVVVLDEGQDLLRDEHLDVIDAALRGGLKDGRWRIFGDFTNQAIYADSVDGRPRLEMRTGRTLTYALRTNCRSTPRISEYVHLLGGLDPNYARVLRPDDGVNPRTRYYSSTTKQLKALRDVLNELLEDGYAPEEIVVLSTRASGSAAELLDDPELSPLLRPMGDEISEGFIHHCTVHAFKGLDSSAIVLTDIEAVTGKHAQDLFYTGITRATDRLVVIADERMGADVAKALTGGKA